MNPQQPNEFLLESFREIAPRLFRESQKTRLFTKKVLPLLAGAREQIRQSYEGTDNYRPEVEPAVLLGVLLFQFLERVPDRAAVETIKYYLWRLRGFSLPQSEDGFHHVTLACFRQHLTDKGSGADSLRKALNALHAEDPALKHLSKPLVAAHVVATVANLSRLERSHEILRLALEELAHRLSETERPDFWTAMWERYFEKRFDYKSDSAVLNHEKDRVAHACRQLLDWLRPFPCEIRDGRQVDALRRVIPQ